MARPRLVHVILAGLALLAAGISGCSKAPEKTAGPVAPDPQTTGGLLVKSNRDEATVEATPLAATGNQPHPGIKGTVNQPLTGLTPGQYAVVVRSSGWPELTGAVQVDAGQTSQVIRNFKVGSLHLDSVPSGVTVKHGNTVLGQTPMVILQLPAGECELALEYPNWPTLAFKTTIIENQESSATARLPHGKLVVETSPSGATVMAESRTLGKTPLTLAQFPAGKKRLRLQAEDYPTLVISVTVVDEGETKVNLGLGVGYPPLNPVDLLQAVWVPDNPNELAPDFDSVGRFEPKNGIVKNLQRRRLFENWLNKKYRYSGVVKSYDPRNGEIELAEESSKLSKYRIVAKLSPEARDAKVLNAATAKGLTLSFYGLLSAVEEPRWPAKVITFELTGTELLADNPP